MGVSRLKESIDMEDTLRDIWGISIFAGTVKLGDMGSISLTLRMRMEVIFGLGTRVDMRKNVSG